MALVDTTWYVSSVKYTAATQFAVSTAYSAGQLIRQLAAPAVNSERVFVVVVSGTSAGSEPAWTLTRGAKTVSNTVTFQECTGQPAVNGDLTNTATWAQVKAATPAVLGQIIKPSSGASYQICTTAGAMSASEPAFSDTAGVTTTDTTAVWTSLGPVGNFPAWGAPHARLPNAYTATWGAPGHKFYLADNHAETSSAAINLNSPATAAGGPTYAICVDRTAALPPVEANYNTGASISNSSNTGFTITAVGTASTSYYQGITFDGGGGSSGSTSLTVGATGLNIVCNNCTFKMSHTGAASFIRIGSQGGSGVGITWYNCTIQLGATGQTIRLESANFEWRNTPSAIQGATLPTTLFTMVTGSTNYTVCRGVDFSAFSGQLLASNPTTVTPLVFEDCKFHASMTRYGTSNTAGYSANPVITVRCDSSATNYKSTRDEYAGSQVTETSITRVGGATDGTTATSDKIVTNAQATFLTPYRMLPLAIWNDVTGADVTVTVYGTINSASLPLNDEIWVDVKYLGNSGSPVASFKTTAKSHPLATGANVASDGSTWSGGGSGAGWSPFKLVATLTSPQSQMKGYIYVDVRAGKASTTYYIDPLPVLS